MLASITPLGERGRDANWTVTIAALLVGATVAGAAAGALAGALGAAVPSAFSSQARLATLAAAALSALAVDWAALLAAASDSAAPRVPGPRRQLDARWRDRYRGWVYGLGYGAQLGVGVATIVSSAATYLMLLAALLTGSPASGALIVGLYGALRGATPLAAAHVKRPEQLLALHGRLRRWRAPAGRLGLLLLGAIGAAALIASVT